MKYVIYLTLNLCIFISSLGGAHNMEYINNYLQNLQGFSGAIAIKRGSELLFKQYYGYANYASNILNSNETRFCIASITKPFTAIAVMKLQEMSKLTVHDPIVKFIPGFPHGDTITLHHLLTHTSGIRNYHYNDTIFSCETLKEMVDIIAQWDLDFEPDTMYRYGNTGYLLLAYIIELISGITFDEFIAEHIFTPANMTETGSLVHECTIGQYAQGYVHQNGQLINAPRPVAPLTLLGNGNLYASIDDMIRWIDTLFAYKIIGHENLQMIIDKHIAMEGSTTRFHGYGWFVDKQDDIPYIECTGALRGFLSKVIRFVDDDLSIIILTNVENQEQFFELIATLPKLVLQIKDTHMTQPKMRTFKQNKLWRDNAPLMMEQNHGSKIHWRQLDDVEFDEAIRIKLLEESQEVASAKDRTTLINELADLYEVIDSITALHQISKDEIIAIQTQKRHERGGFSRRAFVETAEHPIGSFGEAYCLADADKYPEIV